MITTIQLATAEFICATCRMGILYLRSSESSSTTSVMFSDDEIDDYNSMAVHCRVHLCLNRPSESRINLIGRAGVDLCSLASMTLTTLTSPTTDEIKKAYDIALMSELILVEGAKD